MSPHAPADAHLDDLLKLVVCPEDKQPLNRAPEPLIERLNGFIATRALRNQAGNLVDASLDQGLVRVDGQRLYPVRGGIAVLLPEEGIGLDDEDRALIEAGD